MGRPEPAFEAEEGKRPFDIARGWMICPGCGMRYRLRRDTEPAGKSCRKCALPLDGAFAEEELAAALAEELPMLEVTFIDGGQSVYRWVLGIF